MTPQHRARSQRARDAGEIVDAADSGASAAGAGGSKRDASLSTDATMRADASAAVGASATDASTVDASREPADDDFPGRLVTIRFVAKLGNEALEIFAGADPRTETFCHGGRASCAKVYRNVGLDLDSGKPTDTQRLYRVE